MLLTSTLSSKFVVSIKIRSAFPAKGFVMLTAGNHNQMWHPEMHNGHGETKNGGEGTKPKGIGRGEATVGYGK